MNRLRDASSPYLLQHRDNPVAWWEWSDAAFEAARVSSRPVLLSVGYSACHWCHVMAHESFEDPAVAAVMNELFVNIKVDREERPDVDFVYMSALHALGEQGGWPLTMFLTPDGEPFWGGTYFPKTPRYGRPGFVDLLRRVSEVYRGEPASIGRNVSALKDRLTEPSRSAAPEPTNEEFLALSARAAAAFDPVNGGLKGGPKFPNAPMLNMLWRAGAQDPVLREPVLLTLRRMARGGIHDHIGGGFARYSVDERWLVPHFEKMLSDNAQLLELYALAASETGDPLFHQAAAGIVDWLSREMIVGDGGFAASLDADSEGEEGRFYVWTRSEIESILGPEDAALFGRVYDITVEGNFEGLNIPNRLSGLASAEADEQRLGALRARLLAARSGRARPARDDKALADWIGLMIAALARAGTLLNRPDWLAAAERAYRFIIESMMREGRLAHSWRGRVGVWPAFALDQAAMALAALSLAESDRNYLADARRFLDALHADYSDPESGVLAMTSTDSGALIVRPRPTHDDAVPNANGVYLEALIRYAGMAHDDAASDRAGKLFAALAGDMRGQGLAHASLWSALDLRVNGAGIAIAGEPADSLLDAARAIPWPERTVTRLNANEALPATHPAAAMIAAAAGGARAFVCRGQSCSPPVAAPDQIAPVLARR